MSMDLGDIMAIMTIAFIAAGKGAPVISFVNQLLGNLFDACNKLPRGVDTRLDPDFWAQ